MIVRLARRVASSYTGASTVYLPALAALVATALAWPILARAPVYTDVIVGETTWENIDKARDFRALYLFFAVTVFLAAVLSWSRRRRATVIETSDSSMLRMTLVLATLPAIWWLAVAATAPQDATYVVSWTLRYATVAGVAAVIAAGVAYLRIGGIARPQTSTPRIARWMFGTLIVILGAFGGLAIAIAVSRIFPAAATPIARGAFAFALAGAGVALTLLRAILRNSRMDAQELYLQRVRLLFAVQIPLPLLFLVVVPPPLVYRDHIVGGQHRTTLLVTVAVGIAVSWAFLWRRHRSATAQLITNPVDDSIDRIDRLLSPLCVAAVALYVALPPLQEPELALNPAHLHFGERALPWQQLTSWGKLPYSDFIPIHGLMPLSRGLFNAVFFDNAASGFTPAAMLLSALFVVALFFTARPFVGTTLSLVLSAFCLHPLMSDRFFFFAPVLFLLANPILLRKPLGWLVCWLLVVPLMALYNAPIGAAIAIGTFPAAIAVAYRLARRELAKFSALAGVAVVAVAALFSSRTVRAMGRGFLQFVQENQAVNNLANGIAWEQNFHPTVSVLDFVRQAVWASSRVSWIIVALIAVQLAWRELAKPSNERRESLLWLAALIVPTLLVLAQWTLGRIDPVGGSRTDSLSYLTLFQILPVLLFIARPVTPHGNRKLASIGVALAVGIALVDWRAAALAMVGSNAFPPRLISADRGVTNGADVGLPRIGTVVPNQTLDDAVALKAALAPLLRPGETYVNLTVASDFFYYLDLPVPTLYAEAIVPASGQMQARMLRQIAAHRPPVALAAPWVVSSLHDYYLYRDFLLRYTAVRRGKFVLLVEPQRVPEAGSIGSPDQIALLDSIYRVARLEAIPSTWAGSWSTLAPRFTRIVTLDSPNVSHGAIEYRLSDLALSGATADFVKLDLSGASGAELRVRWAADGRPMGEPVSVMPALNSTTLLIPLGATPSWLLSKRIDSLRFEVVRKDGVWDTDFTLDKVTLLHLDAAR